MSRTTGLLLLALTLGGCTNPGAAPPGPPPPDLSQTFVAGIQLASDERLLDRGIYATRFNFAYLKDLWVRVGISQMPQMSIVKLTFTNPKGEVFYETSSPFSWDPEMKGMNMPGMDHPITVVRAKAVTGGYLLDRAVPIGGSVFMKYPAEGTWVIMAKVDETLYTTEMQVSVTP